MTVAALPPVDFSLMAARVPPIAGPGTETLCALTGWSWCAYCGYTGHCAGPRQRSCPERHGWHRWLDLQSEGARLQDASSRSGNAP